MRGLLLLLALCCLPLLCAATAFPTPRGDPDATRAPTHKHALLELIESAPAIPRPVASSRLSGDLAEWLASKDLATAFSLAPLRLLQVPLYVNVFAVGLDGSGERGVDLASERLEAWLAHMDHTIEAAVISDRRDAEGEEEGEHTESSRRRGRAKSEYVDPSSAARIQYRMHYRLIRLSPLVSKVVERVLSVHHREEDSSHVRFHVDSDVLSGALEGLVEHLGLTDGYSLFVLSPSRSWLTVPQGLDVVKASYTYRSGLGNDEIDRVLDGKDAGVKAVVEQFRSSPAAAWPSSGRTDPPQRMPSFVSSASSGGGGGEDKPKPALRVVDHLLLSAAWARAVLAAPHYTGPQPLESYLVQQAASHPEVLRESVLASSASYALESCASTNFVSRGRSAWVDLSAGSSGDGGEGDGVHWGPLSGGEGSRGGHSFPSVDSFVSLREREATAAEEAGEDDFVDAAYSAEAVQAERMVLLDLLAAHQCAPTPALQTSPSAQCARLHERVKDLDAFEKEHADRIASERDDAPLSPKPKEPRMDSVEGMSFFREESAEQGGWNSGHNSSIETDHFLAHLTSTLTRGVKHVLAPAVGHTDRSHGYSKRVNWHLYTLVNHQDYDPLAGSFFARLKFGLEQLRAPGQEFTYTSHKLSMDDDPALAMAYTAALRSAVIPSVRFDGKFAAIKRMYIDSAALHAALKGVDMKAKAEADKMYGEANRQAFEQAAAQQSSGAKDFSSTETRDIPIFLFSVEFPLPVLVDKFFQSQALPEANMVVAVQSNLHLWESSLTCNSKPMFFNLRDPLRSILSSAAHVLGGLLPLHVEYNAAYDRTGQDWLWSVGASPLALTSSQGLEFSQIQRDNLHRNYVLTAWRESTQLVNAQIHALSKVKTQTWNRVLGGLRDDQVSLTDAKAYFARRKNIQNAFSAFTDVITGEMTPALEALQFDAATRSIATLYQRANEFAVLVSELVQWDQRERCAQAGSSTVVLSGSQRGWTPQLSFHWYLLAAIACVAIVLYRVVVPATAKPKLN